MTNLSFGIPKLLTFSMAIVLNHGVSALASSPAVPDSWSTRPEAAIIQEIPDITILRPKTAEHLKSLLDEEKQESKVLSNSFPLLNSPKAQKLRSVSEPSGVMAAAEEPRQSAPSASHPLATPFEGKAQIGRAHV